MDESTRPPGRRDRRHDMRTRELRTTRSLSRVLVAFVLGTASATAVNVSATADVITPFTQVYDQVVYGDFNIIGNSVTKCPATPSPLTFAICADGAGRTDPNAVNDEYQMAWADADTSSATFN